MTFSTISARWMASDGVTTITTANEGDIVFFEAVATTATTNTGCKVTMTSVPWGFDVDKWWITPNSPPSNPVAGVLPPFTAEVVNLPNTTMFKITMRGKLVSGGSKLMNVTFASTQEAATAISATLDVKVEVVQLSTRQLVRVNGVHTSGTYPEYNVGDKGDGDTVASYCDTGPHYFYSTTQWTGVAGTAQGLLLTHVIPTPLTSNIAQRDNVGYVFVDDEGQPVTIGPPYSFRFDITLEGESFFSDLPMVVFRRNREDREANRFDGVIGSTRCWGIYKTDATVNFSDTYGKYYIANAARGRVSALPTTGGTTGKLGTTALRYECRVLPNGLLADVTLWLYSRTTGALLQTITGSIPATDAVINCMELGVNSDTWSLANLMANRRYFNISFWNADMTPFGPWEPRPTYSLWDGESGTETPIELEGYVEDGEPDTVVPIDTTVLDTAYPQFNRAGYNKYTLVVPADADGPALSFDIYVPWTARPLHGWKCVCWGFSGFFVQGSRADIPLRFVLDMIENNFVVVAMGYRVASYASGVHYPDQTKDCKRIIKYVQGFDFIDDEWVWSIGYSAGAYLAASVMLTENITDGGPQHFNFKLSTGNDPQVRGVYTWGCPTSLQYALDYDPLEGLLIIPIAGDFVNLEYPFRILMNAPSGTLNLAGTNLADYVTADTGPWNYEWGSGDILVINGPGRPGGGHVRITSDAYEAAGNDRFTQSRIRSDHDSLMISYDSMRIPRPRNQWRSGIIDWLQEQIDAG